MFELLNYLDPEGKDLYVRWLMGLADMQARARILVRVQRYRLYYAQAGKCLILLLVGGDKRKQQANITAAIACWNNWQERRKSI